jgi:glycopeptide antibiotics resistance protein
LTIEILQAYLPSRTSGVLDIINNTLGTYLGALLFRWPLVQTYAAQLLRETSSGLAAETD